jgi:hypothetical protein
MEDIVAWPRQILICDVVPDHKALRIGTLNGILRAVSAHKKTDAPGSCRFASVTDTMGKKLASSNALLDEANRETDELDGDADAEFIKQRIARMRRFQLRVQEVWNSPMVKLLLK